ncbi:MAG: hypothetical protein ACE5KM_18900, partial [Planctomycetaceae bacterium]
MHDGDTFVTRKVRIVKGQEMRHSVSVHRRHKPGVVGRLSVDFVLRDKIPPSIENCALVAEQVKLPDDLSDVFFRLCRRQTKTILRDGASRDDPVLVDDLRNDTRYQPTHSSRLDG